MAGPLVTMFPNAVRAALVPWATAGTRPRPDRSGGCAPVAIHVGEKAS